MKKEFLWIVVFLFFGIACQAQGINFFKGSFSEAQEQARKQHKYLMIDCYTEWCGWCKFMDRKTYPSTEVGKFYNANFISYQMDMEKGVGVEMNQRYNISMYPSFLFFDPDGNFVHHYTGADTSVKGFIDIGSKALDTANNLMGLKRRFNRGEREQGMLVELVKATQYYIDPQSCEKALAAYWETVTSDQINEKFNWDMFKYFEMDINSKAFGFFYANKTNYLNRYKADSNLFYTKAAFAITKAAENKDEATLIKAKQIAYLSPDKNIRYAICINELPYYYQKGDLTVFYGDIDDFFKAFGTDWIGGVAWNMDRVIDNPKYLKKALEYAEQSIQLNKTFDRTATYARILYKLRRYKDAENAANDALALAQQTGSDFDKKRNTDSTNALLEQIKKASSNKN